jgi:hypothetical protein
MNIRTINQNKHFYKSKRFLFFVLQKIRNLLHNHFITIFFFKLRSQKIKPGFYKLKQQL